MYIWLPEHPSGQSAVYLVFWSEIFGLPSSVDQEINQMRFVASLNTIQSIKHNEVYVHYTQKAKLLEFFW